MLVKNVIYFERYVVKFFEIKWIKDNISISVDNIQTVYLSCSAFLQTLLNIMLLKITG